MVPVLRAYMRALAAVPWQVVAESGQVLALAARKAAGRPTAPGAPRTVPVENEAGCARLARRATEGDVIRSPVGGPEHGRDWH